MELAQILPSIFGVCSFIFFNRSKIYDRLSDSKIGKWIMSPIMIPYVIYGIIKLARDEDFILLMIEAKKQRKITDFI